MDLKVGQMVRAPFGGRELLGYVMRLGPLPAGGAGRKLKAVSEPAAPEPLFGEDFVRLAEFVSNYYLYPLGLCVKEILPGGLGPKLRSWAAPTPVGLLASESEVGSAAPALRILLAKGDERQPLSAFAGCRPALTKLVKSGLAELSYELDGRGGGFSFEWWLAPLPEGAAKFNGRLGPKERELWEMLKDAPPTPLSHFRHFLANPLAQARSLAAKGLAYMERRELFRDDPNRALQFAAKEIKALTPDQSRALEAICGAIDRRTSQGFLLFGVTGSGKTEVYLRAARRTLENGRGVLWLAPEIALTMGLEGRLRERFPGLTLSVLHSGLTPGQRHDHWIALRRGVSRVALGARSAVFAPMADVGLVVVDEEHDWAYKQDDGLRYNGRDLAAWRARDAGAALLLGSATPSLESYQRVKEGRLTLLRLETRPGGAVLPEVRLIDRREEARGGRGALSPPVREALEDAFGRGEQALMFINRRGLANLPLCLSCGEALKCPHCSLNLTLHSVESWEEEEREEEEERKEARNAEPCSERDGERTDASADGPAQDGEGAGRAGEKTDDKTAAPLRAGQELVCHGCGYRARPPEVCPKCRSRLVRYMGVGTESLLRQVEKDFGKKGLRLDADSARVKGGLKEVLEGFARREADFLVGTQMAAKGHDFPMLTMVGVVEADLGLNVADFRAAERTFQLLSQVSGRAGRADRPGLVCIQTRNPGHYALTSARDHDYETFFESEIAVRKELGYPPFARMALVRLAGPDERAVIELADAAAEMARRLIGDVPPDELELFGPAPAPLTKLRERYRHQMMVRSKTVLKRGRLLVAWLPELRRSLPKEIALTVDVDPYNLL
jgi:primosomal protein N' (replication factor Y)